MDDLIGKEKQMKYSSDHLKTDNGSLGCSDKIIEFNIPGSVKNVSGRIKPQNFIRADFTLLRELLGGIPEESALEAKGVQEYWETFRDSFLQAQEQSIHLNGKRSRHSKKPVWLNSELLRELRCKKGTRERWKREQASIAEYRNTSWARRDAERKPKGQLEPKLARDVKSSKKVLIYGM
ncbi:rna-directed dna polymerase from mobile element jockey-like [Limosa lapponica baueri]|uniref:Rna-directed dna polymerase from mobile element jockey-like n=1 Tax=Limosa lapponica baueri TaxID=1758121 RepID=A0A2I0UCU2_LIMLA|nr:rna-directed dna polymerase from mobile element jockey-like [Limosa lapponica baueri]